MRNDLGSLIPRDKFDIERAEAVVEAGYPAVAPILPELFEWIRDCNWPVARIIAPFLSTIGVPLIPHIRKVLETDDEVWKYWVLSYLIEDTPELATALRDKLEAYAFRPTPAEVAEGLSEKANRILGGLS